MAKKYKGTGNNPLRMANSISEEVNNAWEDGSFYEKVSPITQDLLRFWFSDSFRNIRRLNFHEGQKQAILNIIYAHEVLKVKNVKDLYLNTYPELLQDMDISSLEKSKYQHPMYAVKMATGTGKTWVLNALLIWQYLNAKEGYEGFSKNFLIVAPGLIVYNRLLDAFLGKENEEGKRVFETSDFIKAEELFLPEAYKNKIIRFLQSSLAKKDEIVSKVTGDGLIAITNWHTLTTDEENINDRIDPLEEPHKILEEILPISPGKTAGNSLEALDNKFLRGGIVEYLASLEDLVVFNDEAHHIHEIKKGGEVFEVEWQKSLNEIAKIKGDNFIQIDFSATPYNSTSGKNKVKHYFPHVIVDYELKTAIHKGQVKMIAIDRRSDFTSVDLDYKAERDGNKVIGLSKGQKLMLKAGLTKLDILDDEFSKFGENKHPKMLVMCEDTKVAPFVREFLLNEGLDTDDVMEIHSNRKGEISESEWDEIKQRLFSVDRYDKPKVIVSVLMLREGFDVNNICVIVPLRSSESPILLEQTIGRGLRLMWRENEYVDIKAENRKRVLEEKRAPLNYLDLLSIIEHPNFSKFYDDFIKDGYVAEIRDDPTSTRILGDMITVNLKEYYEDYDMYWPKIIKESEEILNRHKIPLDMLEPFEVPLEILQKIKGGSGETFESQELTVRTRFGRYKITTELFNAESYNEFLFRIVRLITTPLQSVKKRGYKAFPLLQVNNDELVSLIDEYIHTALFGCDFNPMVDDNWRILLMSDSAIVTHIVKQITRIIYKMQTDVDVTEAEVIKCYFSEVVKLRMRENYSIEVSKSIYERLPYPTNKGGFEKRFMEAVDRDSRVDAFIKINEYYHTFAVVHYIREDGLLARYYPDFVVKIGNDVYVVETKADKDLKTDNVQSKRVAILDELENINKLKGHDRMDSKWNYVLLGEKTFDSWYEHGASIKEILDYTIMTEAKVKGTLDDYL